MALKENDLTDAQRRVMNFLVAYIREHGWAPTLREIAEGVDYTSTNATSDALAILTRKRWIKVGSFGAARQIRILRIPR